MKKSNNIATFVVLIASFCNISNINAATSAIIPDETKKQAMSCAKRMIDNQVNVFFGTNEEGKKEPVCVITFNPDIFLGKKFQFTYEKSCILTFRSVMDIYWLIRPPVKRDDLARMLSLKRTEAYNLDKAEDRASHYPASFQNFHEMIQFLRQEYKDHQIGTAIKNAYNRTLKLKPKNDDELNIEFCSQFLVPGFQPESTLFNRWLDHCLKHFLREHKENPLILENVITHDSYFYVSNFNSYNRYVHLGENAANTISLCCFHKIMNAIFNRHKMMMTYQNGKFVFQPVQITKTSGMQPTFNLLDCIELPPSDIPNWEGTIELIGNKGDKLSNFTNASIIRKESWPKDRNHVFIFKLIITPDAQLEGSMFEVIEHDIDHLFEDYTDQLRSKINKWLLDRIISPLNIQLVSTYVSQMHVFKKLGVTEAQLIALDEQPESILEYLDDRYSKYSNFLSHLAQDTIDNIRCVRMLEEFPHEVFSEKFKQYKEDSERTYENFFEQILNEIRQCIKNKKMFDVKSDWLSRTIHAIKFVLITDINLIDNIKRSCRSLGKRKFYLQDEKGGFLRKIIAELESK